MVAFSAGIVGLRGLGSIFQHLTKVDPHTIAPIVGRVRELSSQLSGLQQDSDIPAAHAEILSRLFQPSGAPTWGVSTALLAAGVDHQLSSNIDPDRGVISFIKEPEILQKFLSLRIDPNNTNHFFVDFELTGARKISLELTHDRDKDYVQLHFNLGNQPAVSVNLNTYHKDIVNPLRELIRMKNILVNN